MKKQVCCDMMGHQLNWKCDDHDDPFACPDALITKGKFGYGLIVHDGGSSVIAIAYCPWCGIQLS